jgi:hypothetical protein
MRKWMLMVAALAMVAAMPLAAQAEGEKKPEEKKDEKPAEPEKKEEGEAKEEKEEGNKDDLDKMMRRALKDIADVIGKVEATEEDVKLYIKHDDASDEVTDKDETFQKLKKENYKKAFEHLIKSEPYVAWCKKEGLEAENFTRKSLRVMTGFIKLHMPAMLDDIVKQQKDVLEEYKDELPEADYTAAVAELKKAEAMFARVKKELDVIPAPTDAEKKLYETHKKALTKIMNGGDDDEEDIDEGEDDGMGG